MRPIAITMGDAAGIGPEIIAKCFVHHSNALKGCFVAGDVSTMRRALAVVQGAVTLPVAVVDHLDEISQLPPHCLPVLQVGAALSPVPWGQVSAAAGEFAGRCVAWAADAALRGDIAAMVTAPLHKEALATPGTRRCCRPPLRAIVV
jgi:4-hydroxythreonine-4-phosphate dehydrogenase